ncbi:unnamed protein product [Caenorhabditis sp. 36 PRJEB53466]|nr:unnamed protein product [Caenorhabditis sp. 36 PRJEB53466]
MSGTPIRQKRAHQPPSVSGSRKKKKHASTPFTIYNPPVAKLRSNYDYEFYKFLRSVKEVTDEMDRQSVNLVIPMRRQLRRNHRDASNLHLYFKSLAYWKSFYSGFLERVDDVMECFRFDDIREIHVIIAAHRLPESLVSFVTQQLIDWRLLFKDVEWLREFRELSQKLEKEEAERKEQIARDALLREIALEIELSNLKIADFAEHATEEPEDLCETIVAKVREAKMAQEMAERLRKVPVLSKRSNTREWCKKHYELIRISSLSSDDDSSSSSSANNSSLFENSANSSIDSDLSATSEIDIDAFFNELF